MPAREVQLVGRHEATIVQVPAWMGHADVQTTLSTCTTAAAPATPACSRPRSVPRRARRPPCARRSTALGTGQRNAPAPYPNRETVHHRTENSHAQTLARFSLGRYVGRHAYDRCAPPALQLRTRDEHRYTPWPSWLVRGGLLAGKRSGQSRASSPRITPDSVGYRRGDALAVACKRGRFGSIKPIPAPRCHGSNPGSATRFAPRARGVSRSRDAE